MIRVKTAPRPECPNCHPNSGFCPECGEKKFDKSRLSIKAFLTNTIGDFTDLDSKFLRTLYLLTFSPGFLSVEFSRGVWGAYIKPFKLFIAIAIGHFLVFGLTSADLYTLDTVHWIDRFHLLDKLRDLNIDQGNREVQLSTQQVNKNLKDVLSVSIYLVIFAVAGHFYLLFRKKRKFYAEHLVFVIHIISAAFLRNLFLLPVLVFNRFAGFALVGGLNFLYVILSLRAFYQISTFRAILTLVPTVVVLLLMMSLILVVSAWMAMML